MNLVAACKACNNRKANRTPEAAGMKLHYVPPAASHRISMSVCTLIVTEVLVDVWRQRLWFQPHWHAAALLSGCTRVRRNHVHHCNVAQLGRASSSQLLCRGFDSLYCNDLQSR